MRRSSVALVPILALAACSKSEPAATAAAAITVADPHHGAAVDTLERVVTDDPAAAASLRTLAGRLDHEARHRPSAAIPVERVFAALERAGLPLVDGPRQYVGVIAGADYCAGGQTADGLAVAVCEYPSPARATAGKAVVEARFAALAPLRDIAVNGATTLTLTARPGSPLASSKRIATEAFATL